MIAGLFSSAGSGGRRRAGRRHRGAHAGAAGMSVRLLDRAAFPRNKPCGGGISMRVLARFPYLESELSRIATHRCRGCISKGRTANRR